MIDHVTLFGRVCLEDIPTRDRHAALFGMVCLEDMPARDRHVTLFGRVCLEDIPARDRHVTLCRMKPYKYLHPEEIQFRCKKSSRCNVLTFL